MEWRAGITRVLELCFRYSRLYQVYPWKHEILTTTPPIHVYINRINNTLVFKTKDGYKLELQTLESMKLFGNTKQLVEKRKNREKVQVLK